MRLVESAATRFRLTLGMTHRADTRVRSMLLGIWPTTYPTVQMETAVTN